MTKQRVPIALTIAGSDSSGGAGIQADLKTFSALGVYGASVLTALTAQNTTGVQAVELVTPAFIQAQMFSVLTDLDVGAIKTGMLANTAIIGAVVEKLREHASIPVVVDPVMVATSGDSLLAPEAVESVRKLLIPRATLITPNLPEAAKLLDGPTAETEAEARSQLDRLAKLGSKAVLLKGGHGSGSEAVDFLFCNGVVTRLANVRIATNNTHGTGCTLSAAIAALLARGTQLEDAVARAKDYVHRAISAAADIKVGHGSGPVDHLYAIRTSPAV